MTIRYLYLPKNAAALNGRVVVRYDGTLSGKEKMKAMDFVKSTKGRTILVATYATAATGLNLQMFNIVGFIDRNWNPQVLFITYIF